MNPNLSAISCGCDPGINHYCAQHSTDNIKASLRWLLDEICYDGVRTEKFNKIMLELYSWAHD